MRAPFSIVASGVTLRPASGGDIWGQKKQLPTPFRLLLTGSILGVRPEAEGAEPPAHFSRRAEDQTA